MHAPIDDRYRLPEPSSPLEVAELANTLNGMLDRLEASMHATQRFAADAGHELRTPLTALGFDLETAREHPELPAEQRRVMLAAMTEQHQRLTRLLDGLLALARGDAEVLPARTNIDVAALVHQTVAAARQRHPTVHITLDQRVDDTHIDGWPDGLRLAIDNLIDNAAHHGRPNGNITVSLQQHTDTLDIQVLDDGPGIPPDELPTITSRFARGTNARTPGSGLGLSIASQQAQLHGGQLTLNPADTAGLAATLTLRARNAPTPSTQPGQTTMTKTPTGIDPPA